jgi:hypothetical protein
MGQPLESITPAQVEDCEQPSIEDRHTLWLDNYSTALTTACRSMLAPTR